MKPLQQNSALIDMSQLKSLACFFFAYKQFKANDSCEYKNVISVAAAVTHV